MRDRRLGFLAGFAALAAALLGLYHFPYPAESWPRELQGAYLRGCTRAAAAVLAPFDRTVHADGTLLLGRFPMRIVRGCDGGEVMALLAAAVLAFPARAARRLAGLGAGVALVFAANLARVCSLYVIGVARPELFERVHVELWPPLLVAVAVVFFLVWADRAERSAGAAARPA